MAIMASASGITFPHVYNPNSDECTVSVNGRSVPYRSQCRAAQRLGAIGSGEENKGASRASNTISWVSRSQMRQTMTAALRPWWSQGDGLTPRKASNPDSLAETAGAAIVFRCASL
jgi:hypothetical protein